MAPFSLKHRGQSAVKVHFEISVAMLVGYPKSEKLLYVSWRRGRHKGLTHKAFVSTDGVAEWNEVVSVPATLYRPTRAAPDEPFAEKTLHLTVVQDHDKKKGARKVGRLNINLGDVAVLDDGTVLEMPLLESFPNVKLKLSFRARWLSDARPVSLRGTGSLRQWVHRDKSVEGNTPPPDDDDYVATDTDMSCLTESIAMDSAIIGGEGSDDDDVSDGIFDDETGTLEAMDPPQINDDSVKSPTGSRRPLSVSMTTPIVTMPPAVASTSATGSPHLGPSASPSATSPKAAAAAAVALGPSAAAAAAAAAVSTAEGSAEARAASAATTNTTTAAAAAPATPSAADASSAATVAVSSGGGGSRAGDFMSSLSSTQGSPQGSSVIHTPATQRRVAAAGSTASPSASPLDNLARGRAVSISSDNSQLDMLTLREVDSGSASPASPRSMTRSFNDLSVDGDPAVFSASSSRSRDTEVRLGPGSVRDEDDLGTDGAKTPAMQEALQTIADQEEELKSLKQRLASMAREDDERFLVETVVQSGDAPYSSTDHVPTAALLLYLALDAWGAFQQQPSEALAESVGARILSALEDVAEKNSADQNLLIYWLNTALHLQHLIDAQFAGVAPVALDTLLKAGPSDASREAPQFVHNGVHLTGFLFLQTVLRSVFQSIQELLTPAFLQQPPQGSSRPSGASQCDVSDVTAVLDGLLALAKEHHLSEAVQTALFRQVMYYIDAKLFNALLDSRDLTTFSNGLQVKMALSQLEDWLSVNGGAALHKVRTELCHIREAADVLVMNKTALTSVEARTEVCPHLNPAQLRLLLTRYTPDEFDPEPVDPALMAALLQESEGGQFPIYQDATFFFLPETDLARRQCADLADAAPAALLASGKHAVPATMQQRPGFSWVCAK